MITDAQKEKLVKVLNLTTSNHDGEALNAIRLANNILVLEKLTWEMVIERLWCTHCNNDQPVEAMAKFIFENNSPGSWAHDFSKGLMASYRKNRRLTPRQMDTLKRLYESSK